MRLISPMGMSEQHMTSGGRPVQVGTIPESPSASRPWRPRVLGGSVSEIKMGALSLGGLGAICLPVVTDEGSVAHFPACCSRSRGISRSLPLPHPPPRTHQVTRTEACCSPVALLTPGQALAVPPTPCILGLSQPGHAGWSSLTAEHVRRAAPQASGKVDRSLPV